MCSFFAGVGSLDAMAGMTMALFSRRDDNIDRTSAFKAVAYLWVYRLSKQSVSLVGLHNQPFVGFRSSRHLLLVFRNCMPKIGNLVVFVSYKNSLVNIMPFVSKKETASIETETASVDPKANMPVMSWNSR